MGEHEVTPRAVFLDRDGVLNRALIRDGLPYPPTTIEQFELEEGAKEGCAKLKNAGFRLIVVSNQPDVGRGTQGREVVEAMNRKLLSGVPSLDAIMICWHAGSSHGDPCDCRKPKPGLLQRAAETHGLDLAGSYMVGDRWRDVDCAHAAGCRAVFIDRGYREELRAKPEITVATFAEAVAAVLEADSQNHLAEPLPRH
jgi:D-glycero-D-manno-heptose 1,7-bisphosphate phosphatase